MISLFEHPLKMIRGFIAANIIILYCLLPSYFPADWINKKPLSWLLPWMGYYERNEWIRDDNGTDNKK